MIVSKNYNKCPPSWEDTQTWIYSKMNTKHEYIKGEFFDAFEKLNKELF